MAARIDNRVAGKERQRGEQAKAMAFEHGMHYNPKQMFAQLVKWIAPDPEARLGGELYVSLVQQARRPAFYAELGVPDTLDGRFDLILLHVFLFQQRIKREDERARRIGQFVVDSLFADMDRSLRELGVADTGVGYRIRKMNDAHYGRMKAYDAAFAEDATLRDCLLRNVYAGNNPGEEALEGLLAYVRSQHEFLAQQELDALLTPPIPCAPLAHSAPSAA